MVLGVLPTNGALAFSNSEFLLPGLLGLEITTYYEARTEGQGPLGRSRFSGLDLTIARRGEGLVLLDEQAREVYFARPTPGPGQFSLNTHFPQLRLSAGTSRSLTLTQGHLTKHFHKGADTIWRLARIADGNGSGIDLHRDWAGLLTRLEHPTGLALEFDNNADGLRTSMRLSGHRGETRVIARYAYDRRRNLTTVDLTYGTKSDYFYDERNRLVRFGDGQTDITYAYNPAGQVIRSQQVGQPAKTYHYDPAARRTTITVEAHPDHPTVADYDANDFMLRHDIVGVSSFENIFDRDGQLIERRDGNGNSTRFTYDINGNARYEIDAEGRRNTFSYDDDSRLRLALTPAAHAWEYDYDERSNLVAVQDPIGNRTEMANDQAGLPVRIMRADGLLEQREYDRHHLLVAKRDYRGSLTRFERDDFGRITTVVNALGAVDRFLYEDQIGQDFWMPSSHVRPDGIAVSTRYDRSTAIRRATDGEGRTSAYRYGAFGTLVEIIDPKGGSLRFTYDYAQRLVAVTNQKNLVWAFERDAAGRVVREKDFDGMTLTYAYDQADQLIETRQEDGTRLANTYDRSGLRIREDLYEPGAEHPSATRFTYDAQQRLRSAQNADALVTFERDALGRVVAETINGRRVESTYDCCGNRLERKIGDRLVKSLYDPLGAVREIAIGTHAPLRFTRDALGRELRRENGAGFRLDQSYDSVGQLLRQLVNVPRDFGDTGPVAHHRHYAWNNTFSPKAISDQRWGDTTYAYDPNGQVVETRHGDGGVERFDYDATLSIVGSASGESRLEAWRTAPSGRVTQARGPNGERVTLSYDSRRRVRERRVERDGFRPSTWRYHWDGQDRLVRCETPPGEVWRYGYDAFNRRLWKAKDLTLAERRYYAIRHPHLIDVSALAEHGDMIVAAKSRLDTNSPAEAGKAPTVGTCFSWDGDVVAEEAPLKLDGTVDWDAGTCWHYEPQSFRPLAKEENQTCSFVVNDHIGTPTSLHSETGDALYAAQYQSWGLIRRSWSAENDNEEVAAVDLRIASGSDISTQRSTLRTSQPSCVIRFQGQCFDDELGLAYNRHRWYDGLTSQFVSPDPIRLLGGPSLHAYVANPNDLVDPLGLAGFNSGRAPHTATVTVYGPDGSIKSGPQQFQSGNMTPDEKALGFPQNSLATHTESRATRDVPLEPGDKMVIDGQYRPCPTCKGKMNKAARNAPGSSVEYNHPNAAGVTQTWRTK